MRSILALLLREFIATGALNSVVKSLLDGGVGMSMRDRAFESLRVAIRENLWRILLVLAAVCLLLVAAGFLIAAFFLWMLTLLGAPLGAAVTGLLFLLLGAGLLWFGVRAKPQPAPSAASAAEGSGAASFMDMAGAVLRDLKNGMGKYSVLIFVVLFLAGLWLGFQDKDDETPPQM